MIIDYNCDLINSIKLIEGIYNNNEIFSKYSPLYPYTTENIKGITENIIFNNKDILLPCSSSDHILNILLYNPKHITTYDINVLTYHFFQLKKAAVIALDRDKFIDFFYNPSVGINNSFNNKSYKIIRNYLKEEDRYYWDNIFNNYNNKFLRNNNLFKRVPYSKNTIKLINPYLDDDNYLKLKDILMDYEVNFINTPLKELSSNLIMRYDYIYLSNIVDYCFKRDKLKRLRNLVMELKDNLNKDGQVGMVYLYNYHDEYFINTRESLYNEEEREKYFNNGLYTYVDFSDVISQRKHSKILSTQNRDGILTYRNVNIK